MSDRNFGSSDSVAILPGEISHSGTEGYSESYWSVCFPKLKPGSALVRAAIICALLISVAWETPVMARGGFMRGMGRFGMHGRAGGQDGILTPAYILITVSKITDAEAFKAAVRDLTATTAPFAGRLAADIDKPVSWEGTAPEHVVMLQFDNPDQAQGWKSSDAFKSFDAELHQSSDSTMLLFEGLPTPTTRGIGGGAGLRHNGRFDPKAFEPNVKEYDQMLSKMHGICKGC
jgi:uncharacterized protein (DUF1330 family)